jgi:hypothetical protein
MLRSILLAVVVMSGAACGKNSPQQQPDAGVPVDAADNTPDASCFENPQTHEEIINACTTAQKIYKDSRPPLLNADGSLPPLP